MLSVELMKEEFLFQGCLQPSFFFFFYSCVIVPSFHEFRDSSVHFPGPFIVS